MNEEIKALFNEAIKEYGEEFGVDLPPTLELICGWFFATGMTKACIVNKNDLIKVLDKYKDVKDELDLE